MDGIDPRTLKEVTIAENYIPLGITIPIQRKRFHEDENVPHDGERGKIPNSDRMSVDKDCPDAKFVKYTQDTFEQHHSKKSRANRKKSEFPSWYRPEHQFSTCHVRRLHEEIVQLTSFLAPTTKEHIARQNVVERVSKVVQKLWPSAQLHPFGSFATKLYLPSSDIDLVVLCSEITAKNTATALHNLARALKKQQVSTRMQVISRARVPIVKFTDGLTSYTVDVSFNMQNGIKLATWIRDQIRTYPALKPLVLFLKLFLFQRGLNEVFTGGLGSFAILTLVLSFLQQHPRVQRKEIPQEENLGVLLIEFFELYGRHFNMTRVGLCLRSRGSYYRKHSRGWSNYERPHLLSVEDPLDPQLNDIAKNSFNIGAVRQCFEHAFQTLTRKIYALSNGQKHRDHDALPCILISSIVQIDDEILEQRAKIMTAPVINVEPTKLDVIIEDDREHDHELSNSIFLQSDFLGNSRATEPENQSIKSKSNTARKECEIDEFQCLNSDIDLESDDSIFPVMNLDEKFGKSKRQKGHLISSKQRKRRVDKRRKRKL